MKFPALLAAALLCTLPCSGQTPEPVPAFSPTPAGGRITWPLTPGWTFDLQSSPALDSWQPLTWRCGGDCASVDVPATAPRGFFRVVPRPSRIVTGINLDELFSPPCPDELAAVLADWAARDTAPHNVALQGPWSDGTGARLYILRHKLDGGAVTHYGAVRIPPGTPGQKFPVYMICHGGQGGGSDADFGSTAPLGNYIQVVPSYRSEPLVIKQGPYAGTYTSTGLPSVQDRDADDALALLNCALQAFSECNTARIAIQGTSRGANVALRCALRRPGLRGVVDFFGATDFMASYQEDAFESSLTVPGWLAPNIEIRKNIENVLDPLVAGSLTMAQARLLLIRQSPLYFAGSLPDCLVQHGDADPVVYVDNSRKLRDTLTAAPWSRTAATSPTFEYFEYPGGVHAVGSLITLPGPTGEDRRDSFVQVRME